MGAAWLGPEAPSRAARDPWNVAETVPWSAQRRAKWATRWKSAPAAADVGHVTDAAHHAELTGVSPQAAYITREVVSDELTANVLNTPDVRGLAVYASTVKFDVEWRVARSMPFVRRERMRGRHQQAIGTIPDWPPAR
jgi:hypothetical protein